MATALTCLMASCENDDTDFSDIIDGGSGQETSYTLRDIDFDETALAESETIPADDNDYVENSSFTKAVVITYNGDTATISANFSGLKASVSGAHVVVTSDIAGAAYTLTGSTTDGSFKIGGDYDHKLMLTLDNVSINNPTGAAINSQCGKSMYVVLAEGSVNTLSDGATYNTPSGEDEKGTLFSEGQIIFCGSGKLTVAGNHQNGIASDDYIVFRPGNVINVACSKKNCLKANDGISIRGGVLNLSATGDGGKAVNSEANINVSGGRLTAIATGNALAQGGDTTGVAAMKCDSTLTITGGTVNLKATGDGGKGIKANGNVLIGGGNLAIETFGTKLLSSPKGLKADDNLTFSGGSSYIYSANSSPIDADGQTTISPQLTATYSSDNKLVEVK